MLESFQDLSLKSISRITILQLSICGAKVTKMKRYCYGFGHLVGILHLASNIILEYGEIS
jgi:hypothetical protein